MTGRYAELVQLLMETAPEILDEEVQLDVALRIGELANTKLGDKELARTYYQKALELRGDDRRVLAALEALYEETGDGNALLDIIRRRVDAAAYYYEKKELLFRQARLSADVLHYPSAAISVYEAILNIALDDKAIEELETLLPLETAVDRPCRPLRASARPRRLRSCRFARARGQGGRTRALRPGASIRRTRGGPAHRPPACRRIEEIETLLKQAESPDLVRRAAEMLEPVYLGRSDFTRLMNTIEARLDSTQDPDDRRSLLKRLAWLKEEQTEDYRGALETTAKLLHEDVTDEGTWAELERLAKVAGAESRLAEIYAGELEAITSDDDSTAKLSKRTGELFASLGVRSEVSISTGRALAFEPESEALFEAIDGLLVQEGRAKERVELYRGALDYRSEPKERSRMLRLHCRARRGPLADTDWAIETYRAALEVDESDALAQDALTTLYRERGRFTDFADLFEQRAEQASDAKVLGQFRLALARLYRHELANIGTAIDHYEQHCRGHARSRRSHCRPRGFEPCPRIQSTGRRYSPPPLRAGGRLEASRRLERATPRARGRPRPEDRDFARNCRALGDAGNDDRHALDALRSAFLLDPDDGETRTELERLAEKIGAWDLLAEAYQLGIENADLLVKRQLFAALHRCTTSAATTRGVLSERTSSSSCSTRPTMSRSTRWTSWRPLLSDWPSLVRVLGSKAELVSDDEARASLYRRIGETKRDMLDD